MNYTIASLEDIHHDITINFDKNGNRYTVGMWHKELHEYTHKDFEDCEEARERFLMMARYILEGRYAYVDRKRLLLE